MFSTRLSQLWCATPQRINEWLDQHLIETIEEAQDHGAQWLWTYNNDRPNMGIGGITAAQKLKMAA